MNSRVATFWPLGFPVEIEAAHRGVFAAAEAAWTGWPQLFEGPAVRLAVHVIDGGAGGPTQFATGDGWVAFRGKEGNAAEFCIAERTGRIAATEETIAGGEAFAYHYLEAVTLTALDSIAFTPVHGACVARHGKGLLLCGDSGAGKSSLAYASVRSGWDFVSDDAVHSSAGIVVGDSRRFRLREPARALFPEIAEMPVRVMANGKTAIEVPGVRPTWRARASACVLIERRTGEAKLVEQPRERAIEYFERYVTWGGSREAEFDALVAGGVWRLCYERLADAVRLLENLL